MASKLLLQLCRRLLKETRRQRVAVRRRPPYRIGFRPEAPLAAAKAAKAPRTGR